MQGALRVAMDAGILYGWGMILVFVGIIIVIVAAILILLANTKGRGKVRGGGVIIIWPVPIVFGTDKKSLKKVLLLSIALTIILVVVTVVFYLMST
jgi:uncharacterized protein (TIGR00304 family)